MLVRSRALIRRTRQPRPSYVPLVLPYCDAHGRRRDPTATFVRSLTVDHGYRFRIRCRCSESFVDDLRTWRGVVLGRAVSTLRSVETQPYLPGDSSCVLYALTPYYNARSRPHSVLCIARTHVACLRMSVACCVKTERIQ